MEPEPKMPSGRSLTAMTSAGFTALAVLLAASIFAIGTVVEWNAFNLGNGTRRGDLLAFLLFVISTGLTIASTAGVVLGIVSVVDRRTRAGSRRARILVFITLLLSPLAFLACTGMFFILLTY